VGERNEACPLVKPGVHDEDALLGRLVLAVPPEEKNALGGSNPESRWESGNGRKGVVEASGGLTGGKLGDGGDRGRARVKETRFLKTLTRFFIPRSVDPVCVAGSFGLRGGDDMSAKGVARREFTDVVLAGRLE
jgi:hypothetical protein